MYSIKHSKEKHLYYVEIHDKINHLQIIGFLKKISDAEKAGARIRIISDYTDAVIDETSTDPIQKIGLFINSVMKKKFSDITWANISLHPLPTTGTLIKIGKD